MQLQVMGFSLVPSLMYILEQVTLLCIVNSTLLLLRGLIEAEVSSIKEF